MSRPVELPRQREGHRLIWILVLGIAPLLVNGWIGASISDRPIAYWAFEAIIWLLWPTALLVVLLRTQTANLADLGVHIRLRGRENADVFVPVVILMAVLSYWVYKTAHGWSNAHFPNHSLFQYSSMLPSDSSGRLLVALWFGLSAAYVEEIWFRGLFWRVLHQQRYAVLKYLCLSPLVFALAHWESGFANVVATWISGLASCLAYLLLRNLWPLLIGHLVTNFIWFT